MLSLSVLMALLGAAAGSFVALMAERLVRGEPVVNDRSRCRRCRTVLRARDLVPLASYLALRGRCAHCGVPIPALLFQTELLGAALGVAALWVAPDPARALLVAAWMWALLGLAIADLRWFRLPDPMVLLAAALGLALALASDGSGWPPLAERAFAAGLGALAGGGSFWAIRMVYRGLSGRDGMGAGDIKLITALGLALGIEHLPLVILLAAGAALLAAALRARRKRRRLDRLGRVPFGAALALAAIVLTLI